jgi:HPt (histidine-containing phosphotransfer) domain-containing protein
VPQGGAAELAERLAGFDVIRALKRVGGNDELYRRLLGSLVHTQADADLRLAEALAKPDLHQAGLIVHTIKGVAANLGALALAEAATKLDRELKQGRVPPNLQHGFVDALHQTLAEINTVLASAPEPQGSGPAGDHGPASTGLQPASQPLNSSQVALIGRLDALLEIADGEALELVEQEQSALAAVLGSAGLGALETSLKGFDFNRARQLISPFTKIEVGTTPILRSPA